MFMLCRCKFGQIFFHHLHHVDSGQRCSSDTSIREEEDHERENIPPPICTLLVRNNIVQLGEYGTEMNGPGCYIYFLRGLLPQGAHRNEKMFRPLNRNWKFFRAFIVIKRAFELTPFSSMLSRREMTEM